MTCTKLNVFLVAWGAVEIVLFAGIIFGWASLVYVYKLEGFFNYKCDPDSTPKLNPLVEADLDDVNRTSAEIIADYLPRYNTSQNTTGNTSAIRTPEYITCNEQDKVFNLIYTLAVVINGVSSFLNGALWDKFGTRFMRVIGMVTFVPGLLLAAFATNKQPELLYPASILIAYGGYTVLMTNLQLGSLIPRFRSTIISMYCGAYDSSAFVLVFVKLSYESGFDIRYVFFILVAAFSIVVVSTFWYMPKTRIPFPLPPNYKISLGCRDPDISKRPVQAPVLELSVEIPRKPPAKYYVNTEPTKAQYGDESQEMLNCPSNAAESPSITLSDKVEETPSFTQEMMSAMFLLDMLWLSLMRLQSWSFIGRLNPMLNRLTDENKAMVSQYTSVYAWIQFAGIFLAPLSGLLMDRKKGDKSPPEVKRIELIEVCIASFFIDTTAGLLLAIAMTIPVLEVQFFSFVCSVVHRALLYGPNSAFIAQAFSAANFGKLFGLVMTVSAAFSLIQYPLFVWQENVMDGDPFAFNMLIVVLMVVAYIHPLYMYRWCRISRKKCNNQSKQRTQTAIKDQSEQYTQTATEDQSKQRKRTAANEVAT